MNQSFNLIIPTIDVNDDKVTIGNIQKKNLDYVEAGELLYDVETSKATEGFYPDFSGYVVLFVEDGDEVPIGESAGFIFKGLGDAEACLRDFLAKKEEKAKEVPIKASKKAIAYAESIGFDLSLIKKEGLIKTEDIDNYLAENK